MDHDHCINVKPKATMLLQEEDVSKTAISRSSSMGCSSRVYYYYHSPGVPFKWETRPGTPKHSSLSESLPPITPPPALLSRRLPKPSISVVEQSKPSFLMKLKLWKHLHCRKYVAGWANKHIIGRPKNDKNNDDDHNVGDGDHDGTPYAGSEKITNSDVCSSSSSRSSSSSTSFSANSYPGSSSKNPSLCMASGQGFDGCTPWDFRNFNSFSR